LATDEVGHQRRHALIAPVQPVVFDGHPFPQALAERSQIARGGKAATSVRGDALKEAKRWLEGYLEAKPKKPKGINSLRHSRVRAHEGAHFEFELSALSPLAGLRGYPRHLKRPPNQLEI
jgi:hypothetical protein